ncbi:MAG: hypothetical protein ACPGU1_07520 [Myxococcota bacterium]
MRAIILRQGTNVVLVAPTLGVGKASDLTVVFADGQRCQTFLDQAAVDKDAPLTRVPMCQTPPTAGWSTLEWAEAPELGAGRRAWLLEQPNTVQPGAPPPPPVAIRTFFGKRGLAPMDAYWHVSVKRAVGAPLLDEEGRVLCVVFRYPAGPAGRGLCVPREGSFVGLEP